MTKCGDNHKLKDNLRTKDNLSFYDEEMIVPKNIKNILLEQVHSLQS